MSWVHRDVAMIRLDMDTPNRLWAYNMRPQYKKYFKIIRNNIYVDENFIEALLRRKNISDIYWPLIEKYGSESNLARELSKRRGITYESAWISVNKLCQTPINLKISETHEELYRMLNDG